MSADAVTVSVDAIDAALAAATPGLDEDEQRLAAAVLRLLSAGAPVAVPAAAAHAGMPVSRAERALRSWPGVFWDRHGKVTGFWGLALAEMPHRIRHAGTDLHAWCAFDPLFLARVIGDLQVATADPSPARRSPTASAKTASSPALRTGMRCCRSCAPASPGTTM